MSHLCETHVTLEWDTVTHSTYDEWDTCHTYVRRTLRLSETQSHIQPMISATHVTLVWDTPCAWVRHSHTFNMWLARHMSHLWETHVSLSESHVTLKWDTRYTEVRRTVHCEHIITHLFGEEWYNKLCKHLVVHAMLCNSMLCNSWVSCTTTKWVAQCCATQCCATQCCATQCCATQCCATSELHHNKMSCTSEWVAPLIACDHI